ncbi:MAG: RNA chaperone Hfq [Candidatus Riflebacteria bacterium]|nr:RNA chaperone Hfq [Candidatus Riflebacteria bacterium]
MPQYNSQVQNLFLSDVRKKHQPVEVILNTGTSLRGKIKAFDQYSISLSFKEQVEVIYKSAILYIKVLPRKKMPFQNDYGYSRDDRKGEFSPRDSEFESRSSPGKESKDEDYDDFDPPPPRKYVRKGS